MLTSVDGLKVVVTGKIADESRQSAESKLRAAGAHVQSAVTSATDVLVCGGSVGQTKLKAAAANGVEVVSWEQALELMAGGSVEAAQAQPLNGKTNASPAKGYRQVGPMLALKADELPAGENWQFEIKWDGWRGVARVDGEGGVTIASRQGNDLTPQFPNVAAALAGLDACVLDGELVVLDEKGRSSIKNLGTGPARFVAFDLLEVQGVDIRQKPLAQRRAQLEVLLGKLLGQTPEGSPCVGVSPAFTDGQTLLDYVVDNGLEGIVAKRLDSRYDEGARGKTWLKIKVRQQQEFLIVGMTAGKGARQATAGAFLLAVYDDVARATARSSNGRELARHERHGTVVRELVYCGSVGTGGDEAFWEKLVASLKPVDASPLAVVPLSNAELKDVTWVEPKVVVEVRFQHWTNDGRLWHPSLLAVRQDKTPAEVVREKAAV